MIGRAVLLAAAQLLAPATWRLTLIVAALTGVIFVILGGALWMLFEASLPAMPGTNLAEASVLLAFLAATLAGWFLFRAVAMAVMGLFIDGIVAGVEQEHYPAAAAAAQPISLARGAAMGLRSAGRAIGWNLLAAPLYLLLLLTGIGTLLLAVLINAVLLGRDLEAMVIARHPGGIAALSGGRCVPFPTLTFDADLQLRNRQIKLRKEPSTLEDRVLIDRLDSALGEHSRCKTLKPASRQLAIHTFVQGNDQPSGFGQAWPFVPGSDLSDPRWADTIAHCCFKGPDHVVVR